MTHEIDHADVDAQLERGRGHQDAQLAGLQTVFGVETDLPRETAVMGRDGVGAQPIGQVMRDAFREPARVDEHQR